MQPSHKYVLPNVPRRDTPQFRQYAVRVMSHNGPILVEGAGNPLREDSPDRVTWDWSTSDYYIESECVPKPKERRWYTREEFLSLLPVWPANFLVRSNGGGKSTASIVITPGEYLVSTSMSSNEITRKNYSNFQFSHDGGKTWFPLGVED